MAKGPKKAAKAARVAKSAPAKRSKPVKKAVTRPAKRKPELAAGEPRGISKRFDFGNSVLLFQQAGGGACDGDAVVDGLLQAEIIGGARRNVASELIAGTIPKPMGPWGLLVRLVGQPWTYLVGDALRYEWPRELAAKLGVRTAIFFANGLIGRLEAQAYENDRLLIHFLAGPGVSAPDDEGEAAFKLEKDRFSGLLARGELAGGEWFATARTGRAAWDALARALDAYVPLIWHGGDEGKATIAAYGQRKLKLEEIERVDVITFGAAATLESTPAAHDLERAVKAGDADGVRAALAAGADPRYLPNDDDSPLVACLQLGLGGTYDSLYARVTRRQQLDVLRALLEGGAKPDAMAVGEIMERIDQGDERTSIRLLALLFDHGADPSAPIEATFFTGWRPLHVAAHRNRVAVAKFLITRGADARLTMPNGKTPRELIAGQVESLRAAGPSFGVPDPSASDAMLALLEAAEAGRAETSDWEALAEASYEAYARETRAFRARAWRENPSLSRELDERAGHSRHDTLDGDEPASLEDPSKPPRARSRVGPAEVTLIDQPWPAGAPKPMLTARKALLAAGFEPMKAYMVVPLFTLRLEVMLHPTEHVYAVMYAGLGNFPCDLKRYHEDGTSLLVTNVDTPADAQLERPGHRKLRLLGASADELVAAMRAELPRAPVSPVTASEFAIRFVDDYAAEMAAGDGDPP